MKKLIFVGLLLAVGGVSATEYPITLVIHGGAGTIEKSRMTPKQQIQYRTKLKEALKAGYQVLQQGKSSQQAVITAIQVLEHSPLFNAGRGAVYTYDERHELDASIMDGNTLNAGAVAGVKTIKSPIAAAQQVMLNSPHVMLSGEGAEQFAQTRGLEIVDNHYFDTERRLKSLRRMKAKMAKLTAEGVSEKLAFSQMDVHYKYGTVGAVALDKNGNLTAGTSTGGMTAKRYGRIGDSPIIGAGTYANNASCAVSATGHGEYFIRYHVAADICARMQYLGVSVKTAGDRVINHVLKQAGGSGGVIILDRNGNFATPFNSKGMYRGVINQKLGAKVAIFDDEKL